MVTAVPGPPALACAGVDGDGVPGRLVWLDGDVHAGGAKQDDADTAAGGFVGEGDPSASVKSDVTKDGGLLWGHRGIFLG